jgi:hypothetical protein
MKAGSSSKPVEVRSEGQRLLLARGVTLEAIADATGCSRPAALNWRSGVKLPSDEARRRLATAFGIPAEAWGLVPGAAPTAPAKTSAPPPATPPSTLAECLNLHASIRRARSVEGLTAAERVKLTDTETRLLALRHRLEREQELLEDRLVKEHPAWARLRRALVAAVAPCQRCSKLLLEQLTRLDM